MPTTHNFAYHAMEAVSPPCEICVMRIRLREFRDRLGLGQEEMADRVGVSVSQISRWEAGGSNIPSERLPELARAYECRIADIFEEDDSPFEPLGPKLYVKGAVAAGVWREAWEEPPDEWATFTGRADVNAPLRDRFGLRVEGDSMNEIYPPGTILDCVSLHANVELENGRRVVVQRQNAARDFEVTVKEYYRDEDGVEWLVPRSRNPAFQTPLRMDQQDPDIVEVRIIAVVVGSYRKEY